MRLSGDKGGTFKALEMVVQGREVPKNMTYQGS